MPRHKNDAFDLLDYKIIEELRQDARRSASDIARAVGANERTIRKRLDHILDLGAIRATAIVNPEAFGYSTVVDVFLDVEPDREAEVIQRFMTMQEISYVAYGHGSRDVSIEARFKDNDAMREFLRHTLPAIPGVKVTASLLVPRILKNIDSWMPRPQDFGLAPDDDA